MRPMRLEADDRDGQRAKSLARLGRGEPELVEEADERTERVAGSLRLELAQYRELAAFAQFGSDLDKSSQQQLNRGRRLVEVLKQGQYQPLPFEKQVLIVFAGTNAFLDDIPVEQVRRFEAELYRFVENAHPGILQQIREKKVIDDSLKAEIKNVLAEFKQRFTAAAAQAGR